MIGKILLREDEENKSNNKAQRTHTRQNLKRHIPLVSLLLWHKMVAIRYSVWALGLQLWLGSE